MWNELTTQQRIEAVLSVLATAPGASAAEIGKLVGTSRASVLGIVHRQHDLFPTFRKRPVNTRPTHAPKRLPGWQKTPKIVSIEPAVPVERMDRYAAAFQALPGSSPVTLTDLERGQCRWPIGEKPTLCCGLPSTTGRYCPEHERLSGQRLAALV